MSYDIGAFEKNLPDPETIRTAGTTLKTKAASFSSKASSTSTSWAKLQGKGVYSAPGDEVVFSAFGPVTTAAEDLVTDIGTVKTATDGFADDVDTIRTKLAGIKADAASFESEIAGRSRDDWDDDEGLVKKEQDIIHGLNGLYAELQTAQMTCANSINALYGGPTYVMVTQDGAKAGQIAYGYTNEQLDAASNEGNIPWGKPTEWDKPWYKDAWDGVCSFGKGVWSGVTGTLKGLWNMVNVTDMDTFKATWKGMGKLALNVAIVSTPLAQVALRATGHGDVVDRAGKELLAVGKAAIHWDDWKRDPAYAAGETTFDLATILLTAGGGAVAKTGSIAGKIAEVSSAGGKMATVLNATKISALANVTIKGVDLVNLLKIKGITIATDGIKVAGTKIAELPVKISGGTSTLSTRMAAMADQLGLGGPRVATAGGHGLADAAGGASMRPTVMHLGADTPSRPTGTTGAHPGTSGGGSRAVPEGEPRFGVRTEDGTPTGKPVTQGTHPDAPESGTAKPAASTTHPEAPEGSAKPAAAHDVADHGNGPSTAETHTPGADTHPAGTHPHDADVAGKPNEVHEPSDPTSQHGSGGSGPADPPGHLIRDGVGNPTEVVFHDGTRHEVSTSRAQLSDHLAMKDLDAALKAQGKDYRWLSSVVDRQVETLSTPDLQALLEVRRSLPPITDTTVLQKVLPHDLGPKMFDPNNKYRLSAGGFITDARHSIRLSTPAEIHDALRLDYTGSKFLPDNSRPVYAVRFTTDNVGGVLTPDQRLLNELASRPGGGDLLPDGSLRMTDGRIMAPGHTNTDWYPNTGHGFAGSEVQQHRVMPEYNVIDPRIQEVRLNDGAEMWELNASGEEVLVGVFDGRSEIWRRVG
ncbi:hypothetical protein V6N00_10905 [Tersicoccus sp. MR15.9]|uniref:hypothetical protein n=1 Tax=Tersicoccus mangrovi TaxID=3121635 RepID=UPI002FE5E432